MYYVRCSWGKVTDKVVFVHYINSYWHIGGIVPLVLNLARITWGVVSFTPGLLYIQYLLNRRQDGPQSQSGCFGEELPLPAGNQTMISRTSSSQPNHCTICAVVEDRKVKVISP